MVRENYKLYKVYEYRRLVSSLLLCYVNRDTEGSDSAKVQTEDPLFSDCSDIDDVKFSIQNELNNESKEEE